MRFLVRTFFKTLRLILGPLLLAQEWLVTRNSPSISRQTRVYLDELTSNLVLYQFRTCPFCTKVRIHAHRLGINLKICDAQFDHEARTELGNDGGQIQVPCLRIQQLDGKTIWLYESKDINLYLSDLIAKSEPITA